MSIMEYYKIKIDEFSHENTRITISLFQQTAFPNSI